MERNRRLFNSEAVEDPQYKSLYEILGIMSTATLKEIKTAYKKRASETHSDKPENKGREKEFLRVKDAYDILSDSEKRKLYDKIRREEISHPHFSYKDADWSVKRKVNKLEKAMKELDQELIEELRDLNKHSERHKDRIENFESYANRRREELKVKIESESLPQDSSQAAA